MFAMAEDQRELALGKAVLSLYGFGKLLMIERVVGNKAVDGVGNHLLATKFKQRFGSIINVSDTQIVIDDNNAG